jgi:DNA-binding PadR family transcriptional regulator
MRKDFEGFGFAFDIPWPFGRSGTRQRGRGRRGSWFGAGDLKYVILEMLAERPMHGYEVMNALEERTQGCYRPSPGSVYPTLQWLEDEGLVRIEEADGKKVYHVTDQGRAFLAEHRSTVDEIFDRVTETIRRAVREPMPEVNRAVGRVVKAAYRAAWRGEAEGRQVAEALEQLATELEAVGREP